MRNRPGFLLRKPNYSVPATVCSIAHRPRLFHVVNEQMIKEDMCDRFASGHEFPTEKELRAPRVLGLNMRALAYAAASSLSNTSIPRVEAIGEGGWNRVYQLTFDDGAQVAARIPITQKTTATKMSSVVATMTFARFYCGLPVPEIYAWNSSASNSVGCPYILMEVVGGEPITYIWGRQSEDRRRTILHSVARLHSHLSRPLPFNCLGSIHFSKRSTLLSPNYADPGLYTVGPYLPGPNEMEQCGGRTGASVAHRDLREYWSTVLASELDAAMGEWSSTPDVPITDVYLFQEEDDPVFTARDITTAADNFRIILVQCSIPEHLQSFCLVSDDYALRNIHVDPDTLEVTSILDWDNMSVLPFILSPRYPDEICDSLAAPWD
ncbi:hypothetical protein OE88DRAFT_1733568 [Heliocybe sulcata]|uniref:Altered inheritance of mitochondria protein 9, mitochondrial n=1 Tax=Heliocybe sulcata TaxID=5364 RepID=A0A5C3N7A0_9AGAM|nr:hypothetical protein OE88DRAFT_1733568 [Heliocybe sulcata]